jgi:ABC-type sugar transport system substrate-binding protein
MPELKTRVAKYEASPTNILVTQPVSTKATRGKTIALLICGVPVCAEFNDAATQAANLLGWKVIRIPLGTSPQEFTNAYNLAIQDKPDMVVGSGLPRSLFSSQLDTLQQMNIPVIEWSSGITPVPGHLWVNADTPLYQASGVMLAEVLAENGNLKSHVVTFSDVQYPMTEFMVHALQQYGPQICPTCTFDLQEEPASAIGSLGPIVTAYLQQHPNTNYVFCGFGDLCQGVGEAIKAAGFHNVKIVTRDSSTTNFQNIKTGLEWASLPLPIYQTGYQIIDLAQRIFNNQTTANTELSPMQIVTHITDPASQTIGAVPDFKAQYQALWKLNG